MSDECAHRWVFQRSTFTSEPDGRFYSFYTRYDHYVCEHCRAEKQVVARRENARWRPSWYRTVKKRRCQDD